MKPRKGTDNVKSNWLRLQLRQSVMDDLITDYTAFGVKLAGTSYRLLYGTREVGAALLTGKGNSCTRIVQGIGGRLSRSSDEFWETGGSKGLSLFSFMVNNKQQCND